jgi:hypothetical protein
MLFATSLPNNRQRCFDPASTCSEHGYLQIFIEKKVQTESIPACPFIETVQLKSP